MICDTRASERRAGSPAARTTAPRPPTIPASAIVAIGGPASLGGVTGTSGRRTLDGSTPAVPAAASLVASLAVATATILTTVGVLLLLFLNPVWVDLEQRRAGADRLTGYPMSEVRRVTDEMIAEVYLGPGTFAMAVGGEPVLTPRERGHMADVHDIVAGVLAITGLGALSVVALGAALRGKGAFWRGVALGSGALVTTGVIVGGAFAIAFEDAFLLFHRTFFPAGNFSFDPRVDRLVQLFPEPLFVESSIAMSVVGFLLSLVVLLVAIRRLRAERSLG